MDSERITNRRGKRTSSEEDLTAPFLKRDGLPFAGKSVLTFRIFLSETSRLPYAGLALPTLVTNDNFLETLEVRVQNEGSWSRTVPLADMDGIVAKEFAKDYPIEMTKAITGSLAKGGFAAFSDRCGSIRKGTCAGSNRSGRWSVFTVHYPGGLGDSGRRFPSRFNSVNQNSRISRVDLTRSSDELSEEKFPF